MPERTSIRGNPFYFLLIVTGLVFCVTACAYGVMTVQGLNPEANAVILAQHPMILWLDEYGFTAMIVQIVLLAIFTVSAIALDERRDRKRQQRAAGGVNAAADVPKEIS